jgi:hypothetical protein
MILNKDAVIQSFTHPFRHWVVDHFLTESSAFKLYCDFPEPTEDWYSYSNVFEIKRSQDDISKLPSSIADALAKFNMRPLVEYFEKMTGIEGLVSDPWLRGGGCHYIQKGGKLDVHADFNLHPHLKLDRRLNAILYLNQPYDPLYQGQLELWNMDMSECVKKIDPIFNRLVVFETTDTSYHGHPEPWMGYKPRISLALYYYTNGRPEHEKSAPHSTLFKKRPQDDTTEEIELFRSKRGVKRQ